MKDILGITEQSRAMHYLEIFISSCHIQRVDCTKLEILIHAHLEGWQSKTLSMMSRATLIRLVLSTIPDFFLSHTIILWAILSRLKQLFRNFLLDAIRRGPGFTSLHGMWCAFQSGRGAWYSVIAYSVGGPDCQA